jgi:hypothetical protein
MSAQVEQLCEQIKTNFPWSRPRLTSFPSGAAMLDVKIGAETYVLEYLPSLGAFGVSRMSTAVFGWEGFEQSFDDFESAKEFVLSLLRSS